MRCRGAFSLVEVLIVCAIALLLMALLLPAVQMAREAGRRSECRNKLRQIGLAVMSYHEVHGRFPPGSGTPWPYTFATHTFLLPYLECGGVSSIIDFNQPPQNFQFYPSSPNDAVARVVLPVFLCPSDSISQRVPGVPYGANNYCGSVGTATIDYGNVKMAQDGIFCDGSATRIADIYDGTSCTSAFSESLLGDGNNYTGVAGANSWERGVYIVSQPPTESVCASGNGQWLGRRGDAWISGGYFDGYYNHYAAPNPRVWDCVDTNHIRGFKSARSLHPGGVSVLYCDGSVRFVADGILLGVWRAVATRSGGEVANQ